MDCNLFICSNVDTLLSSSIIIEEELVGENNICVVVANNLDERFLRSMQFIADRLGCFSKVLFYNNFAPMQLNKFVPINTIREIDIVKFKQALDNCNVAKIYSTYFYIHSKVLIDYFKKSQLYFIENGTASYFNQSLPDDISNRTHAIYSFGYFKFIKPLDVTTKHKFKNIIIDKDKLVAKYENLAELINYERPEGEKAIIIAAHNLALNKRLISEQDELGAYFNVIKKYKALGFTIYFKDHPKTPLFYSGRYGELFNKEGVKILSGDLPIESFIVKIKPVALVSVFSSSLFTASYLFGVPSYSIRLPNNNLNNYRAYKIAYAFCRAYFPDAEDIGKKVPPISFYPLEEEPLVNCLLVDNYNGFMSRKKFRRIQKNIKSMNYTEFGFFGIPKEIFDIYQNNGSYWAYLEYYAEMYVRILKVLKKRMNKKQLFINILKILKDVLF